ncbi:MAG TPA: xanthine dehydrogenase family protein subunit M [Blastocatellia bacterium]|nr:xanthine dehydrogenase family protein subunit M [Blastocatellia bacterium]
MPSAHSALSPTTLAEVFALLSARGRDVRIIAGGTDLMVLINAHLLETAEFLDIWGVHELRGIEDEGDALRIGALTTYTQLIKSALIQQHIPSLVAASRTIGAIQIQNRGTIGGNIVNASPAGDSLPVLAAYDAEVELGSARGTRRVRFNQFYTGYRRSVLEPDELVLAVLLPKLRQGEVDFFWKVGTRRAQAISKTVMACKARGDNQRIDSISIAVGSVAPTVVRALETERLLTGASISAELIKAARKMIAEEISPITDLRSTEHYRRTVTGNVLAKFLRQLG